MASKQVQELLSQWQPRTVIPAVAIIGVVVYYIRVWYRLRMFKGPWLAGFSQFWLFLTTTSGELHLRLYDVNKKYGDLARVGPNWLITSDPDIIRHMSSAKHKHQKSSWYTVLKVDAYIHNVFSETNIDKHDRLRAKMQSGYSLKENRDLDPRIDGEIASLVNLIERKYLSTPTTYRPIDFATTAQYWALDVITSITFGKPFGYLAQDKDLYTFIRTVHQELPLVTLCSSTPILGQILFESGFVYLIGGKPTDPSGRGKLLGIAKEVVGTRFGADAKKMEGHEDMLGSFVRNGLDQRQAEAEILNTVLAGSDTTATAIRSTMLHIMTSPRVYSRLVAEINAASHSAAISSPVTSAEARKMPYLQAVIKEGLRIHPPITGLLAKMVNPGGEVIKGRFVPGGTAIGHCVWVIERNEVYGEDVDDFRPERWLEAEEGRRKEMERTMELVFGSGRWGCLGKSIVLVELDKIFVELLRRFDFSLVNPTKPWNSKNFTLFLQKEMWVRVTKREEGSAPEEAA